MLATRVSNSIFTTLPAATHSSGCLVQIYPAKPLERPFELSLPRIIIGRDDTCELHLDVDAVSRQHALLSISTGRAQIQDLNSTNGTFVNDERVSLSTVLRCGDRVRIGNQIFKYISSDAVETQYHEVIYKLMTTDGLTQVYNKRFLLDSIERNIRQSRRGGQSMCVMMTDLDKFKSINDQYGHMAGDAVLVEYARRASSVLRSGETFARYGGEEFSIVCVPAATLRAEFTAVAGWDQQLFPSYIIATAAIKNSNESQPETTLGECNGLLGVQVEALWVI